MKLEIVLSTPNLILPERLKFKLDIVKSVPSLLTLLTANKGALDIKIVDLFVPSNTSHSVVGVNVVL